jgi:hypothetical protein
MQPNLPRLQSFRVHGTEKDIRLRHSIEHFLVNTVATNTSFLVKPAGEPATGGRYAGVIGGRESGGQTVLLVQGSTTDRL